MRELFEAEAVRRSYDITQTHGAGNYDWGNTAIFYEGFQAACNMFLQHVTIVGDDAEPQVGDGVFLSWEWNGSQHNAIDRIKDVDYTVYTVDGGMDMSIEDIKILTRNGKFCIRESELIKQDKS